MSTYSVAYLERIEMNGYKQEQTTYGTISTVTSAVEPKRNMGMTDKLPHFYHVYQNCFVFTNHFKADGEHIAFNTHYGSN